MATRAEQRAEVVATVRDGYISAREIAERAGITHADEDAAGPPAVAFATMALGLYTCAAGKRGEGPDAMRFDAEALEMLAVLCEGEALTWAEVRS